MALNKIGIESYGTEYYVFPENNNEMFSINEIEKLKEIWNKNKTTIINAGFDEKWPWPENYFDIINSDATIEHLKDPKKFLDRCYKELKTGGYFILSTPNLTTLLKRLRFLLGRSPLASSRLIQKRRKFHRALARIYNQRTLLYVQTKWFYYNENL